MFWVKNVSGSILTKLVCLSMLVSFRLFFLDPFWGKSKWKHVFLQVVYQSYPTIFDFYVL